MRRPMGYRFLGQGPIYSFQPLRIQKNQRCHDVKFMKFSRNLSDLINHKKKKKNTKNEKM